MDAMTRYRRRLKVQAALCRVLSLLADNVADGIPADPMTGELAAQVVVWLTRFMAQAEVQMPNLADGPDLTRFLHLQQVRMKETAKRKRRRTRRGL